MNKTLVFFLVLLAALAACMPVIDAQVGSQIASYSAESTRGYPLPDATTAVPTIVPIPTIVNQDQYLPVIFKDADPNAPIPTSTPTPPKFVSPTPTATNTPSPTPTNTPIPTNTPTNTPSPTPTNTPTPTPTPTPLPRIFPTQAPNWAPLVNFDVARQNLPPNYDLAYNKIGFHMGVGGNATGLSASLQQLDAAGIPFFLKTVDNAGIVFEAQEMRALSGVPHNLVYRSTGLDVPNYSASPQDAAIAHWAWHTAKWPPELDKEVVWFETMNELDKNRSEWLAEFSIETAKLALRDGYKWAAFGWSGGEPEQFHWEGPKMLELLRLMEQHPDRLGIALHEYSFSESHMRDVYPQQIGRFMDLFEVADANNIARPKVFITEFGWGAFGVPPVSDALPEIHWAANLYAQFPEVIGAGIWYLGPNFGNIHNETQLMIAPVTEYTMRNYFPYPTDYAAPTNAGVYPYNPPIGP